MTYVVLGIDVRKFTYNYISYAVNEMNTFIENPSLDSTSQQCRWSSAAHLCGSGGGTSLVPTLMAK